MTIFSSSARAAALLLAVPLLATVPAAQGAASTASPASTESTASAVDAADRVARGNGATPYALKTRGYGTKVVGGDLPAGSETTAFQRIGCTNKAGRSRRISEADVAVPGLGLVSGVTTTVRTTRRNGVVASTSTQRVARVTLADSPLGSLSIEAVRSRARAFHDGTGFKAAASVDVGRLVLTPAVGPAQELPLPAPGDPVEIPGLATVKLGPTSTTEGRNGSAARATGLVVTIPGSGTTATVGLARASMSDGVEELLFRGSSAGVSATGLDGVVTKGRTPLSLMPCQGTLGKVQSKSLAGLDLPGAIELGALSSEQRAHQKPRSARAYEQGSVASIDLGDGAVVIDGVVGRANLVRKDGRTRFTTRGTTVGQVTVDGEPRRFPDTGPLEIPGVASLEPQVVERTRRSIAVVGLRITLLDGTGAVIDLGIARLGAQRSGRP